MEQRLKTRIITIGSGVIVTFFLSWMLICCETVPAGYVGVKVYLLGGQKGVDNEILDVGRCYVGFNEKLYLYPVYVQQYRFTQSVKDGDSPTDEAFYFQNKDGVKCNVDISIQARADSAKVTSLFQRYREDLKTVMKVNLRNFIQGKIQEYASMLSVEELYSNKKIEMIRKVEADLKEECNKYGIIVEAVSLMTDIRFPHEVEQAIVGKIQATQDALKVENQVKQAKAEAEIKVVNAKAEAEAMRLKQVQLTPLYVQYMAVMTWDGALPSVIGDSTPFINLKPLK